MCLGQEMHKGLELSVYEDALMQRAEEKTARRKSQTQADIKPTWTVYCAQCRRDCHSGKGLCSHKKRYCSQSFTSGATNSIVSQGLMNAYKYIYKQFCFVCVQRLGISHTANLAFRHLPRNSAGTLYLSLSLFISTDAVRALRKVWYY